MKLFRRTLSLLLVLAFLSTACVSVLAADHNAGTPDEMQTAFTDTDPEVNINVTADIDMGGAPLTANENSTYNITTENNSSLNEVSFDGGGTVNVETDITGNDGDALTTSDSVTVNVTGDISSESVYDDAVRANDSSNVTVTGNISSEDNGVNAYDNSNVTVNGNITVGDDGVYAKGNSNVTVNGNIIAEGNGVDSSKNSNVTVTGDITAGDNGVEADDDCNVTVTGNIIAVDDGVDADENCNVTVTGNITAKDDGVYAYGDSNVTVIGNIIAKDDGVDTDDDCNVTVTGNITSEDDGVYACGDSNVTVTGNITAEGDGVYAYGDSNVTVNGNVSGLDANPEGVDFNDPWSYSEGGDGVIASENATVTVTGDVTGGDAYGTNGEAGDGVGAYDASNVTVGGNITGGNVIADPETKADIESVSEAGDGVIMDSTATVNVGGNVTGGSTNGDQGIDGSGATINLYPIPEEYRDEVPAGSLTVTGYVQGGGDSSDLYIYCETYGEDEEENTLFEDIPVPSITLGAMNTIDGEGLTDEELERILSQVKITGLKTNEPEVVHTERTENTMDPFWQKVLKQVRAAEEGSQLTIDAEYRTSIPTIILQTAAERNITLIIRWNGGEDITVDSALELKGNTILLADLAELVK